MTTSKEPGVQAPAFTGTVPGCFASLILPGLPHALISSPTKSFPRPHIPTELTRSFKHWCFNKYQMRNQCPVLGWTPVSEGGNRVPAFIGATVAQATRQRPLLSAIHPPYGHRTHSKPAIGRTQPMGFHNTPEDQPSLTL